MARVLILAGGCRGRDLARVLDGEGHAVRITTRSEDGRAAIEATGAECWIGTPDRLATLRGALDGVAVACWLLGTAQDEPGRLGALHSTRLELFLTQMIDTTVRGFVYEGRGVAPELLAGGEGLARELTERNRIPAVFLAADPGEPERWQAAAHAAVLGFLGSPSRT